MPAFLRLAARLAPGRLAGLRRFPDCYEPQRQGRTRFASDPDRPIETKGEVERWKPLKFRDVLNLTKPSIIGCTGSRPSPG